MYSEHKVNKIYNFGHYFRVKLIKNGHILFSLF